MNRFLAKSSAACWPWDIKIAVRLSGEGEFRDIVGFHAQQPAEKYLKALLTRQSEMFWTVRGANAIIALRCYHLNGRFEDYWEARRAA